MSTTPPSSALIQLTNVCKDYPTPAGPFRALSQVSLQVKLGEFLAITGKSGAGKTTLVNMITGTDHLTSGEVWVDGVCVHTIPEDQRSRWRGKNIGVIYQSFHLLPKLSLLENVMLPMDLCGLYRPRLSQQRAADLLRAVELQDHANKLPSQISGGQQQRVAIARALANDPALIVADEPTGRLDSVTAQVIFDIFQQLIRQGKTIVMVTHDRGIAHVADRVVRLRDGALTDGD
ncbi:ABC-type antimicrobial peptide transport system, ATPase component [Longilinea arvoryzae]|uniref:ABC-type antimicrobial peptide transport system, ATPase component n=1 Tax=Longilinea arvoryzae TaxID=360412 RepID=A0A0S7BPC3_9CHLR|nr:ABC transporter ATP-binding protein [Longilinea arvoryzae]GAP15669.1 ABC-type antimicrobial peptide transport system, ATPase component [Longilinea arvoryzae]